MRAETDGTFVDPSSVESPYQRGMTERAGKTFKMMLSKAMETYVCSSEMEWRELVDVVNMQKNRLLLKSGYSPIQRVIGYAPRIPGGLLTGGADNRSQPEHVRIGDEGARKSMEMRKAASLAFHEADCSEAFRRAISAGPRPLETFEVGELVYFWRVGMSAARKAAPAYWHGPGRVVMTHLPSTVWISYQGTLVKASPERVRRASEEEQLTLTGWIDSLVATREALDREPKRGYLDLSDDPLPPDVDGAAAGLAPDDGHDESQTISVTREDPWQGPLLPAARRVRARTKGDPDDFNLPAAETLDPDPESTDARGEPSSGVAEEGAEAEASQSEKRELDADDEVLPEAKRSRLEMLELYMAKVNALTRSGASA